MDRKIKLLAACSVAALTTVACAPNAGTYAPHNQQTLAGSTTAPVTHSHSGKVHSHPLPATGIRHTHAMGGSNTGGGATQQQQQPAGNNSGGTTHSHSGRTHSHNLPASGLNHTHRMGGGSAAQTQQVPQANNYTPPVANNNQGRQAHSHNGKVHSHPLPASGLNHGHNMGGQSSTNVPAAQNPYTVPTATAQTGNNSGTVSHSHNGRTHSHRLPASGINHTHRGVAGTTQQPQNNGASGYYDNATDNSYVAPTNNNSSYYDYSDQGGNSAYYDTARPKDSANYQPQSQPKPSAGSFAPENYTGSNTYTVKRGDTVFQVMRNTGVYWKDIIRLNNLQAPNYQINPGQRLRLR